MSATALCNISNSHMLKTLSFSPLFFLWLKIRKHCNFCAVRFLKFSILSHLQAGDNILFQFYSEYARSLSQRFCVHIFWKKIKKKNQHKHKHIIAVYFHRSVVSNTNGVALEVYRCNAEYHLLIQILIDVSELSVCKRQTDAAIHS